MLEIPESYTISRQLTDAITGRTITHVEAAKSPHGFAWYFGTPDAYPTLLEGRTIGGAKPVAGQVQIAAGGATMLFADGVNLRLLAPGAKRPAKPSCSLSWTMAPRWPPLCRCTAACGPTRTARTTIPIILSPPKSPPR